MFVLSGIQDANVRPPLETARGTPGLGRSLRALACRFRRVLRELKPLLERRAAGISGWEAHEATGSLILSANSDPDDRPSGRRPTLILFTTKRGSPSLSRAFVRIELKPEQRR